MIRLFFAALAISSASAAEIWSVPAGKLSAQIAAIAEQAQLHVLTRIPLARMGHGPAVSAADSMEGALDRLLAPHGLRWVRLDERTIRIEAIDDALQLTVGPVDIVATAVSSDLGTDQAHGQAPSAHRLLAERTAAGLRFDRAALAVLPKVGLAQWLARTPNAYGSGSRLSLRGIERDGFAGQTSSVTIDGIVLSSAMLDGALSTPPLEQLQILLGPQPRAGARPSFAGDVRFDSVYPDPDLSGSSVLTSGPRRQSIGIRQHWTDAQDHALWFWGEQRWQASELAKGQQARQGWGMSRWRNGPNAGRN